MHVKMWDDEINYRVSGSGHFPFDMLRRDRAWPRNTADAVLLDVSGYRTIELTASRARDVNVDRWASFGWQVEHGAHFPYAQANPDEWQEILNEGEDSV